jgi:hypothetical protein
VARLVGTGLSLEWLDWLIALAGLAAVLGHARSIWLHFSEENQRRRGWVCSSQWLGQSDWERR